MIRICMPIIIIINELIKMTMVMNLRLLFICKQAKKIDRDRIEETKAYLETEMQIRFRDFEINC